MEGTTAIGIFCEDVREEKSGQVTLVGIFADNLNVPEFPSAIPKLGMFMRVNMDPNNPPKEITSHLKTPWGPDMSLGHADSVLIKTAVDQSRANHLPVAGILMKTVISPFEIPSPGQAVVSITVDGKESVCAVLNLIGPIAST